ncbi:hypothetical protein [Litoribacter populi]|uniref:hypothetical protein n=1 Tax=Litoribacter populi TaxID=2598460 RepID=UPI00117CF72E|nr:hypothetical protein [Litoribacter populi]
MEAEFQRGEKELGKPLSTSAAAQYYDFTDLKWALYKDMAFLGLVTAGEFDQANLGKYVSELEQEKNPDPIACFRLLATTVQGNNYPSGFFEYLIKLKYVLQILQGLKRSFQAELK